MCEVKGYKKILIQLFFLLFVTETFGIYKYVHFCGTEKTSESFFIEKNSCVCGDDEDEADDCCTDQTAVIQFKEENTLTPNKTVKSPDNVPVNLFYETRFSDLVFSKLVEKSVTENTKYLISDSHAPLIIRHCSLLI